MSKLTKRERTIITEALRLRSVDAKDGYVADYNLVVPELSSDEMREIRDVVQSQRSV